MRAISATVMSLVVIPFSAGCGSGDSVPLTDATGIVTYQGAPVARGSVTFIPEKGPIATGITDQEGKFELSTGGRSGAPIGKCGVSIALFGGEDSDLQSLPPEELSMELTMQMGESPGKFGQESQRSTLPAKYANASTSGLEATVTDTPSKNYFEFKL